MLDLGVRAWATTTAAQQGGLCRHGVRRVRRVAAVRLIPVSLGVAVVVTVLFPSVSTLVAFATFIAAATMASISAPMAGLVGTGHVSYFFLVSSLQSAFLCAITFAASQTFSSLFVYLMIAALSVGAPTLVAYRGIRARLGDCPHAMQCSGVASMPRSGLRSLGIRQLTGVLAFGLTAPVAIYFGGHQVAPAYAMPSRVYPAIWSIVSLPYFSAWQDAARSDIGETEPSAAERIRKSVNSRSLLTASLLAPGAVAFCYVSTRLTSSTYAREAAAVALLLMGSVVIRAAISGDSLAITTRPPCFGASLAELLLVVGTFTVVSSVAAPHSVLATAMGTCCGALVLMACVRLFGIRRSRCV